MMKRRFSKNRTRCIAVMDVGATKVCCWIVRLNEEGDCNLLGIGHQASRGLSQGCVTDMEALEGTIAQAVHDAETTSGQTVREIWVNMGGYYCIRSALQKAAVAIQKPVVQDEDVSRLIKKALLQEQINNFRPVHTIPLSYSLDGQKGIQDPRGMAGNSLEAWVHIISGAITPLQNLFLCLERCHLEIQGFVASGYAAGLSCLAKDERELGATILDLGGDTTHLASFWKGHLIYTGALPLGGNHITHDIACGLETAIPHAERLKILYGASLLSEKDHEEMILVPQFENGHSDVAPTLPRAHLIEIIQHRVLEILRCAKKILEESGRGHFLKERIILTGGTSQLPGMREMAILVFGESVRLGRPFLWQDDKELTKPHFSTLAGLFEYARKKDNKKINHLKPRTGKQMLGSWRKIIAWLKKNL